MKKTIFSRLFKSYLVLVLSFSFLFTLISFRTIKSFYITTLSNNLKKIAFALDFSVEPLIRDKDYDHLQSFVKETGKN
ncbi:hypothetical protein KKC59_02880, partial [bacterium]|nr:hypothetical protein [bacterium]